MGTTPKGFPYPEPTDDLRDGADAIAALATAVDTKLPYAMTAGRAALGDVQGGATGSLVVTFPVGLFSQAPLATVTGITSYPSSRGKASSYGSATTSAMTVYAFYDGASTASASLSVAWHAVQPTAEVVADGLRARAARALDDGDEPVPDATVTCPTPGCPNEGYPIPVVSQVTDEDGTTHPPTAGFECGVCGADISDTLAPLEG